MTVLVDTNVLLDWMLKRQPFAAEAAQVLDLSARGKIEAHVAAISITNAYYVARVPRGAAFAEAFVRELAGS